MDLLQRPAGEGVAAGTPLEELQVVPLAAPRAHLPLLQHRLTDVAPEVAGAAQVGGAVGRAEAGVAHLTWRREQLEVSMDKLKTSKRMKAAVTRRSPDVHPPPRPPAAPPRRRTHPSIRGRSHGRAHRKADA